MLTWRRESRPGAAGGPSSTAREGRAKRSIPNPLHRKPQKGLAWLSNKVLILLDEALAGHSVARNQEGRK